MRRDPHLLRVDEGPASFAPLVAALGAAGLRAGWLDLVGSPAPTPTTAHADLEAAAAAGVLRAVAAGGGRSVAVKPLKGPPVLGDLLREHFRGCVLVLVRGAAGANVPQLAPEGPLWKVTPPEAAARILDMADLVTALRRPRPWD